MNIENRILNLLEEIFKLDEPELVETIQEYYKLMTTKKLSDKQADKLSAILYLAIFDQTLDKFVSRVDVIVNEEEGKVNSDQCNTLVRSYEGTYFSDKMSTGIPVSVSSIRSYKGTYLSDKISTGTIITD